MDKKSSNAIQLVLLGGLLVALGVMLADEECSNDPNAPSEQRCPRAGSGHGSFGSGSGSGSGGGAETARSERGGFGAFARRFNIFS